MPSFTSSFETQQPKLYFSLLALQEGTSKFASLESCAKEHQKRTHKRLQLQKEMVRQRLANEELLQLKKKKTARQMDLLSKSAETELSNLKQHIPLKQCTVKPDLASPVMKPHA